MHRQNAAERAIKTYKNHFISRYSTTDPDLPISKWDLLLSQWGITLNLLRNSEVKRALSAYAYLFGPYNFNKSPMALTVTRMLVHVKPGNWTSWGHNGTTGWYIGPYLYQYRCMQCYMPATVIEIITDTLQYIPKEFSLPKTTTQNYIQQNIGDIIAIMKNPPKNPCLF